jgi:L-Ala-D/L-Glu epimerase
MTLQARQMQKPLYTLLSEEHTTDLQYYGSIGIGSTLALLSKLLFYKFAGFRHFKVKVTGIDDITRIAMVKKVLGKGVTLFADANCAWSFSEAVENAVRLYRAGVWALEEPLQVVGGKGSGGMQINREALLTSEHYRQYHRLKQEIPLPLIADESCISPQSFDKIIDHDAFSIANIRLSKNGGTFLCNRMFKKAVASGMSVGLGAMVGESPFLATIGSHFGAAHPNHRYIQGHSHRVLHRVRIGSSEPKMAYGGKMHLESNVQGTGVVLCAEVLDKLTTNRKLIIL